MIAKSRALRAVCLALSLFITVFPSVAHASTDDFQVNYGFNYGESAGDLVSSEDGQVLLLARGNGNLAYSTDAGANWTQDSHGFISGVQSVAISSDGSIWYAAITGFDYNAQTYVADYIYKSTDHGANWTQLTSAGTKIWSQIRCNGAGTKIVASIYNQRALVNGFVEFTVTGSAFFSSNSGSSFTKIRDGSIYEVAISQDGNTIAVGMDGNQITNPGSGEYMYASYDGGSTFSAVTSIGQGVTSIKLSTDGLRAAAVNGSGAFRGTRSGSTWTWNAISVPEVPQYPIAGLSMTATGKTILIAVSGRFLYISNDYGVNVTLSQFTPDFNGSNLSFQSVPVFITPSGKYAFADIGYNQLYRANVTSIAPSSLTATPASGALALSWVAPSDAGNGSITNYSIQYSSDSGANWNTFSHTTSTSTTINLTGLTNGTSYQVRVAGITSWGTGDYASVTATPSTVPGAPTSVSGTAGNGQVNLSWTAPSSNGGDPISDYLIEYSSGGSYSTFAHSASSSTTIAVTGLTNGTAYTFRVSAINGRGTGSASTVSASVTPITTPSAVNSLAVTAGNAKAMLTWSAPSSNGGSAITDYIVEYSTTGTSGWTTTSGAVSSAVNETVTGLVNGTLYYFRVTPKNAIGNGTTSGNVSATPSTVASAPTNLLPTAGNSQVSLAFTAGSDGGAALSDYLVEYSSNAGSTWSTFSHTPTTSSPIVITGLTNYSQYIFRLTGINANGQGATSSNSSAATPGGTLTTITLSRQSVGTAAGATFSTQPQITLKDQYSGTLIVDSSTVITATISSGGALIGTSTATAIAGIATFTNLGISGVAGNSYTVTYSAAGVTSVTQSITVSIGQAVKLSVSRNGSGSRTSVPFTTQPQISVVDSGGNVVTTHPSTTVRAVPNLSNCFVGSADTATTVSGVATFASLSLIAASGTQCMLTYTATSLTSTYETLTVASGPAAVISRTIRPDYGYYGRAFGQQPVYTIQDSGGNNVTTDNSTVLTITTPNNAGSTIFQESATAVNGVVTFTNLGFSGINAGSFVLFTVTANSFSSTYTDSIMILKGDPILSWANSTKISGDAPYTVTAPTSNAAGTFTYTSSNSSVATVASTTITITGQGTTTLTATLTPTDTTNFNSGVSITSTLAVSAGAATVTISLAGGVTTVSKGTPITITASVNVTGRVSFYINGKSIGGCTALHTTSSATCAWKPAVQGKSVTLSALLRPSSVNYSNARSNLLQVGVNRRTGRR